MRQGRTDTMFALKNTGVALAALLALFVLGGCGGTEKPQAKGQVRVGHEALDAASRGFVDGMAAKGFKEGQNVSYDRQNAQADQSNLQNIAHRFTGNKVDLICAIATPAAQSMANATSTIPIVATAVTDYRAARLVQDNARPGGNVTGTTDMNPVAAQLDLLMQIVPGAQTIGTIYCSSEVNSQLQVELLRKAAAAKGVNVKEATVSTVNDIQQAARSLLGSVQALYIPTDNVLSSALPTLLMVTDEARLPVICGEGWQVKAGGLATLGVDYYQLGVQTGAMAAEILSGRAQPAAMPIQAQTHFTVLVNQATARKIGVTIPPAVLQGAEVIQ